MLVSSYNTYIDTTTTRRAQNERKESVKKLPQSFVVKPTLTQNKDVALNDSSSLNYVSKYKVLKNSQELQKQELFNNPAKMKFAKISSMSSAQIAYGENSKMFSLLSKPKPTLSQTPKPDKNLPQLAQNAKEGIMKTLMVNTYISNENYYKITA